MKKFSEEIKDFFYDAIDYILMIVIVLVVAGIIFWRLNILFDENNNKASSPKNNIETTDNSKVENGNSKEDENTEKEEDLVKTIKITIPAGATSSAIADILVKEGLIEDPEQFILKARELGLETKLKSGDFDIDKNSSIEDMVKTIAQQK